MNFFSTSLVAAFLVLVSASSHADEPGFGSLNLSIPRDVITDGKLYTSPHPTQLLDAGYKAYPPSPTQILYKEHAIQKIFQRLKAVPPQDKYGKQICGEIEYRTTIRTDGTVEKVEVLHVKPQIMNNGQIEVFSNFNPQLHDYQSATKVQELATNEEQMSVFENAMREAILSAAPFAAFPAELINGNVTNGPKVRSPVILISGTFGRECHRWAPAASQSGRTPKTPFD